MIDGYMVWSPGITLDSLEKQAILKAYDFYKKNKLATANSLGIALRTLDNKLERYEQEDKIEQERKLNDAARHADFLNRQRGNPPRNDGLPYTPYSTDGQDNSFERHFPSSGIRMEPTLNSAEKPTVPVSQREEVQKMSSPASPKSGKNRGR